MSNNIIQITEENLRKAVESGDLKQLAPELFEKKKVKIQVNITEWSIRDDVIFPVSPDFINCKFQGYGINRWDDLLTKPPMLMTLEWEE